MESTLLTAIQRGDTRQVQKCLQSGQVNGSGLEALPTWTLLLRRSYERALKVLPQDSWLYGYCLFASKAHDQCAEWLASRSDEASLCLEAQLHYTKGEYAESLDCYRRLAKTSGATTELYVQEVTANVNAVQAMLAWSGIPAVVPGKVESETYEDAYNLGCLFLAMDSFDESMRYLNQALTLCRTALEAESSRELERDLLIIEFQLTCVRHLTGKEGAQEAYSKILESKFADSVLRSLATVNLAALQDLTKQSTIVSAAKDTLATSQNPKLTLYQKRSFELNRAVLAMHHKKGRPLKKVIDSVQRKVPDAELPQLIEAWTSKHRRQEVERLVEKNPSSILFSLALAQTHHSVGQTAEAIKILSTLLSALPSSSQYVPGVAAAVAWIQHQAGDSTQAVALLKKYSGAKDPNFTIPLTLARIQQAMGALEDSLSQLAALYKQHRSHPALQRALILAQSQVDVSQAEALLEQLPGVSALSSQSLPSVQEAEAAFLSGYKVRVDRSTLKEAKRRRRRKANRVPKNFDPERKPDPERWIPKRERSTFAKRGKKKRDAARGPQGVATDDGGLGGTGSANIGGSSNQRTSIAQKEEPVPSPVKPTPPAPSASKKKKKGRK